MKKFKLGKFNGGAADNGYGKWTVIAFWDNDLICYRTMKTPGELWRLARHRLGYWALFLQVWPVYFTSWSRDCDLCEATYRHRFPTYWHADRYFRRAYEDAEGPMHATQVSRKEYDNFEATFRDRIGEAFDDGRGTSVII